MRPTTSLRLTQLVIIMLSVAGPSAFALVFLGAAQMGPVSPLMSLVTTGSGLALPFVLRAFLSRLLVECGARERIGIGYAFAGVFFSFAAIPLMLAAAGKGLAAALADDGVRRRANTIAMVLFLALFPLPLVANIAGALLAGGEHFIVFVVANSVVNVLVLAVGTQLLLGPTLDFIELSRRAPVGDLGGVSSEASVAVRSS